MIVMHVSTADASSSQAHQHLVRVDGGHIHLLVSQVFGSVEIVCAHGGFAFLLLWLFLGAEPVHVIQFPSQATHLNQADLRLPQGAGAALGIGGQVRRVHV